MLVWVQPMSMHMFVDEDGRSFWRGRIQESKLETGMFDTFQLAQTKVQMLHWTLLTSEKGSSLRQSTKTLQIPHITFTNLLATDSYNISWCLVRSHKGVRFRAASYSPSPNDINGNSICTHVLLRPYGLTMLPACAAARQCRTPMARGRGEMT
jgi:hypothetical protein